MLSNDEKALLAEEHQIDRALDEIERQFKDPKFLNKSSRFKVSTLNDKYLRCTEKRELIEQIKSRENKVERPAVA